MDFRVTSYFFEIEFIFLSNTICSTHPLLSILTLIVSIRNTYDIELFSRQVQDGRRGDLDGTRVPFAVGDIETAASQLNGRQHFVHRSPGSGRQIYVDEVGLCLPVLPEHRVRDHGSASSVGSVASSAKLAAAGNAARRPSRCESSSSDVVNSLAATQREEVSE